MKNDKIRSEQANGGEKKGFCNPKKHKRQLQNEKQAFCLPKQPPPVKLEGDENAFQQGKDVVVNRIGVSVTDQEKTEQFIEGSQPQQA